MIFIQTGFLELLNGHETDFDTEHHICHAGQWNWIHLLLK